jgi:hypothetical protein
MHICCALVPPFRPLTLALMLAGGAQVPQAQSGVHEAAGVLQAISVALEPSTPLDVASLAWNVQRLAR